MTTPYQEQNQFDIPNIDYSIIMGIYHIKKKVDEYITTQIKSELSITQIEILSNLLAKRCKTSTDLAKRLRVSKANLTGIIQRLEMKNIITRKISENDKRAKILTLTPKGEKIANHIIPNLFEMMSAALGELSHEQKNIINHGLADFFYALKS